MGGLARGGRSVVMGYAAGTETTMRVTDLVWKLAYVSGFSLFAASTEEQAEAHAAVLPLIASGEITPAHGRSFPLEQAPEALRHLVEDRPYGKVTLTVGAYSRPSGPSHSILSGVHVRIARPRRFPIPRDRSRPCQGTRW